MSQIRTWSVKYFLLCCWLLKTEIQFHYMYMLIFKKLTHLEKELFFKEAL